MNRLWSRVLAVASVGIATLAVAVTSSAAATRHHAAAPSAGIGSVNWGACSDPTLAQLGAQCGYLSVPLNYSKPNGQKIQLAVSRLQHTSSAADYQGAILTNPGGPGGSGLSLSAILASVLQSENYPAAAADYDWIGFDPRGVGSSIPALTCDPNFLGPDRANYIPTTHKLLNYWKTRSKAYAAACNAKGSAQSALLKNDTTVDSAQDMNSIRQALGLKKISYYGFSYGTYLGQVYSTLYPSHLNRLILDSNVDPRKVWYQANLDQDVAFNRNINIWFGWLAKYNSVYHLGATKAAVSKLFYATQSSLEGAPAGGVVGPDEWNDIFLQPAYYEETWLDSAQLFSDWVNDPGTQSAQDLVDAYDSSDSPGDDNELADYLAVECSDAPWQQPFSKVVSDNWATFESAPFMTWGNAWFNGPCSFWPAKSSSPLQVNGDRVQSGLLIDETLDAATPFPGSVEVRKLFPKAVLLAEPGGTSHADSLFGDACVDGTIADYLTTGALPPRDNSARWDKTCAPLPQPVPDATSTDAKALKRGGARAARAQARLRRVLEAAQLGS
jgi:pimeloyl-ACP methyl ester carboxylesterase